MSLVGSTKLLENLIEMETQTFFSAFDQLGCKDLIMRCMGHDDPQVRYEALISVQKLMVHNW